MTTDYLHYQFLLAEQAGIFKADLWEHDCSDLDECGQCPAYAACNFISTHAKHHKEYSKKFDELLTSHYQQLHTRNIAYYHEHFPEFTI